MIRVAILAGVDLNKLSATSAVFGEKFAFQFYQQRLKLGHNFPKLFAVTKTPFAEKLLILFALKIRSKMLMKLTPVLQSNRGQKRIKIIG